MRWGGYYMLTIGSRKNHIFEPQAQHNIEISRKAIDLFHPNIWSILRTKVIILRQVFKKILFSNVLI